MNKKDTPIASKESEAAKKSLDRQKPSSSSFFVQKKFIFSALVLIIFFVLGIYLFQKVKETQPKREETTTQQTALPKTGDIKEYVQSEYVDLDGDGTDEAVAIYHDGGDKNSIYKVFFTIFKLKDDHWVKLIEQRLEALSEDTLKIGNSEMSMTDYAQEKNKFQLAQLTGDNLPDVLVETQSEGTGVYLGVFIYGLKNKKISELWQQSPVPKGVIGVEKDKVWLIVPDYGPDDPNCCPGQWTKEWWEWKTEAFVKINIITGPDFEKIKATPFSEISKTSDTEDSSAGKAILEGSLSYPSEGIPKDLTVCAQDQDSGELFCTDKKIEDSKYQYHYGYKLEVPPGRYLIYAKTSALPGYKAYFSEHVICGSLASCPSHEPVIVIINANATISNIDPGDWTR